MPATDVGFFKDDNHTVPVLDWLRQLRRLNRKAFANCVAKIRLLRVFGHELRRPHVDYLRDGIYELRAKERNVQYRILFFYAGHNVVVLAHALTKESVIPARDIDRAMERKKRYEQDPGQHLASETIAQDPTDI
jgi:phage-related protein